MKPFAFFFHVGVAFIDCYALFTVHSLGIIPDPRIYLILFTLWVGVLHFLAFLLAAASDLAANPRVLRASSTLFHVSLVAGLAMFAIFWSIYYYDRNLIHPPSLDHILPWWLNSAQHAFPPIASLLDLLVFRKINGPILTDLLAVGIIAGSYLSIVFSVHYIFKRAAYPFLAAFSMVQFGLFSIICIMFALVLSYSQRMLVNYRWPIIRQRKKE
eukprot:TRINITY_DN9060_c0_g1_i1.p1 TRINITY_DN9060_c0_g1~~TRINITY_DN9060_c0_g1_i1.p1  ORF type:complete len:214 (-),score=30.80 TRINITY_DN9060_c0_g1_i1:6-647(-)